MSKYNSSKRLAEKMCVGFGFCVVCVSAVYYECNIMCVYIISVRKKGKKLGSKYMCAKNLHYKKYKTTM